MGCFLAAHVVHKRAATALCLRYDDLNAMPPEQSKGGIVDRWLENSLCAAGEHRHATTEGTVYRSYFLSSRPIPSARWKRRKVQHRGDAIATG